MFFKSIPPIGAIRPAAFVVDRDAFTFHPRLQDRDQRRTIAQNGDWLIDAVFEQVADFVARGRGFHAGIGTGDGVAE